MEKDIVLRLFNRLIRGESFERTLYNLYLETGEKELYTMLREKLRGEEVDIPYTQEAEILSTLDRDRERLSEYLRKIIDIEYIKGEIKSLRNIFRKRIIILLLILYITIPMITALAPIFTVIKGVEVTNIKRISIETGLYDREIFILHGLVTETISTIYLYRIARFRLHRMLIIQLTLFIIIYPQISQYIQLLLH